ncbi:MAG: S9 family peptidase, partial [Gammaproteobacteria bacterium]
KRALLIDDCDRFRSVEDPQCSPDGKWIAYTVSASDVATDSRRSSLWMVSFDGTEDLQLTLGKDADSTPRFSPDGRSIAFLSARPADGPTQVWVLDRRGGEARALTHVAGHIEDFAWSPDGKRLALVMRERTDATAPPKPIVIDRFGFKSDIEGYLESSATRRLYLFDIGTKDLTPLTGDTLHDEHDPAWSPDGKRIAFVSNHATEPDRSNTNDIFVVEARPGARPAKIVTAWAPNSQRIAWSPDGRLISYLVGEEPRYYAYAQDRLAVVPSAGGEPRALTAGFDRKVSAPAFSADGASITVMVEDDRVQYPARVPVAGGAVERIVEGTLVVTAQCTGGGRSAMLVSTDTMPPEIHALEGKRLRKLTGHNDALMAQLALGAVEDIAFPSEDGTMIHGLMVKPPSYRAGRKYPTILWIHGGPNMQDDHSLPVDTYALQAERHLLAAQGYVVLAVNYRGSSGRGDAFARTIFADWGNREVADLRAA